VTGDLVISLDQGDEQLVLPELRELKGSVVVSLASRDLTWVSFPNLLRVGRQINLGAVDRLEHVDFGALEAIGVGIRIIANPHLVEVWFPRLEVIYAGGMTADRNARLRSLDFVNLRLMPPASYENKLLIGGNDALEAADYPLLSELGSHLAIDSNVTLRRMRFPELANVVGIVKVTDNPMLSQCDVDRLRKRLHDVGYAGEIKIWRNGESIECPEDPVLE
jgi:hypothetical protein